MRAPVRRCRSSGSAEMVAVSSLLTYDIYKPYFKPKVENKNKLTRMLTSDALDICRLHNIQAI